MKKGSKRIKKLIYSGDSNSLLDKKENQLFGEIKEVEERVYTFYTK